MTESALLSEVDIGTGEKFYLPNEGNADPGRPGGLPGLRQDLRDQRPVHGVVREHRVLQARADPAFPSASRSAPAATRCADRDLPAPAATCRSRSGPRRRRRPGLRDRVLRVGAAPRPAVRRRHRNPRRALHEDRTGRATGSGWTGGWSGSSPTTRPPTTTWPAAWRCAAAGRPPCARSGARSSSGTGTSMDVPGPGPRDPARAEPEFVALLGQLKPARPMNSPPTASARSRPRTVSLDAARRPDDPALAREPVEPGIEPRPRGRPGSGSATAPRSTPAFMPQAEDQRVLGEQGRRERRVRSSVIRSPVPARDQLPRSATFAPRQPPCWEAADGPSPIHSSIRHVLRLCRHAWPGRAKLEISYWS